MSFELHPRLAAGTTFLGRKNRCQILLKNNAAFPWILIVPEVDEQLEDLHQLSAEDFGQVAFLIREVSNFVEAFFEPEKLNVGCIGNIVRQMHIHLVGRTKKDAAWPGTVWASDVKENYSDERKEEIKTAAQLALGLG